MVQVLAARGAWPTRGLRAAAVLLLSLVVTATGQLPSSPAGASDVPGDPTSDVPAEAAESAKPNILLITADDQSVAELDHMPFTRELLGGQGATFTQAISQFPLCCPARATLLTGQLNHNNGVIANKPPFGGYPRLVGSPAVNEHTLPVWLQAAGYHTMFVGKYLNRYGLGGSHADVPPGWDEWWAAVEGLGAYNYFGGGMSHNGVVQMYPEDTYKTDLWGQITRDAIVDWTAEGQDKPFFIWESDLAPHGACHPDDDGSCRWGPAMPAEQDEDRFSNMPLKVRGDAAFNERVVSEKPMHLRRAARWGPAKMRYMTSYKRMRLRSLQALDRSVKQTVELLDSRGELDNTLIIFTSDNGYLLGQHRASGKILPYEESLRVPLLMRWGSQIPAGAVRQQSVGLVDLAPTIADAAGATAQLTVDGRSVLDIARGVQGARGYGAMSIEAGPNGADDPEFFYHGVRTRRYTYVEYPGLGEVELYDRRKDPAQLTNVGYRPAYAETRDVLAEKLAALRDCAGAQCRSVDGLVPGPEAEPHLAGGATVHPDDLGSIGSARQVVTITAPDWATGRGKATAWERVGRTWRVRRGPFAVKLGERGLVAQGGRRAGGKTPAGSFRPAFALGRLADPGTPLRYRRFDRNDYWVHDRAVPATYNVYLRRRSPRAVWRESAAERWWEHRRRYPHALVLRYNLPRKLEYSPRFGELQARRPADVRRGSFVLHVGARLPGYGWSSMPQRQLRWMLRWMRPAAKRTTFVVGTPTYLRNRL